MIIKQLSISFNVSSDGLLDYQEPAKRFLFYLFGHDVFNRWYDFVSVSVDKSLRIHSGALLRLVGWQTNNIFEATLFLGFADQKQ